MTESRIELTSPPGVRGLRQSPGLTVVLCLTIVSLFAPTVSASDTISLSWRLIGNRLEGGYEAELTIRNGSDKPLAADWVIYFNSASRLLSKSLPAEYVLTRMHGDFY